MYRYIHLARDYCGVAAVVPLLTLSFLLSVQLAAQFMSPMTPLPAGPGTSQAVEVCCDSLKYLNAPDRRGYEEIVQVLHKDGAVYTLSQVYNSNYSRYGALTKTDAKGNYVWRAATGPNQFVNSFLQTASGDFLIAGGSYQTEPTLRAPDEDEIASFQQALTPSEIESSGSTSSIAKTLLFKVNSEGQPIWHLEYYERLGSGNIVAGATLSEHYFLSVVDQPSLLGPDYGTYELNVLDVFRTDTAGTLVPHRRIEPPRYHFAGSSSGKLIIKDAFTSGSSMVVAANYEPRGANEISVATLYTYRPVVSGREEQGTVYTFPTGYIIESAVALDQDHLAVALSRNKSNEGKAEAALAILSDDGTNVRIMREVAWDSKIVARWSDIATRPTSAGNQIVLSGSTTGGESILQSLLVNVSGGASITMQDVAVVRPTGHGQSRAPKIFLGQGSSQIGYADSRPYRGDTGTETLLTGLLPTSLTGRCLVRGEVATSESAPNRLLSSVAAKLGSPAIGESTDTGAGNETLVAIDDCVPDLIDGCSQSQPALSHGLLELARPQACNEGESVRVRVFDNYGRQVDGEYTFNSNRPIRLNLTDKARGTYSIYVYNSTGSQLHQVVSVRLV